MSENLRESIETLKVLGKLSPTLRKQTLKHLSCNDCYYKAIKEIARNIVNQNIKINTKLKRHWSKICEISGVNKTKKRSKKSKQELVNQSGGWLWSIIPLVLSIIESLT
jgi:hypothetical protein